MSRIQRGVRRAWQAGGLTAGLLMLLFMLPVASPNPVIGVVRPVVNPAPPIAPDTEVVRAHAKPKAPASSSVVRVITAKRHVYIRSSRPQKVLRWIKTKQRVVFITIDDGWSRSWKVARLLRRTHVPITAFLMQQAADHHDQIRYFKTLQAAGAVIEDHTMSHPFMPSLPEKRQRYEICHTANNFAHSYGVRPTMFRPPFGGYNAATLRAAAHCKMGATFLWDAEMRYGHLSTAKHPLRGGDIILMHFRPELYSELNKLFRTLRARHLGVGSLQDFVRFGSPPRAISR